VLWDFLNVEKNIGATLTENFAMSPTATVSGLYFAHPDALYFSAGKIQDDQIKDYAKRRSMSEEQAQQYLRSI